MFRISHLGWGGRLSLALAAGLWVHAARAEEVHVFPLDGTQVVPPNHSKGTANATVILKGLTGRLRIEWRDLSGRPTRFEIHGPALAGHSGPLLMTLAAPRRSRAGADSAFVAFPVAQSRKKFFRDEQTYLTVRTARFPAGEIRGQIIPTDEENDEDED